MSDIPGEEITGPFQVIELLLPPGSYKRIQSLLDNPDDPLSRYEIQSVNGPYGQNPFYRRHGIFKFTVILLLAGYERLTADLRKQPEAIEFELDESEFLGYALAGCGTANGNGYLVQLLTSKAERARRSKNAPKEKWLRERIRILKDRYKGEAALQERNVLRNTIH